MNELETFVMMLLFLGALAWLFWGPRGDGFSCVAVIGLLAATSLLAGCGIDPFTDKNDCELYANHPVRNVPAHCIDYFTSDRTVNREEFLK